jgi:hypothetical protein
VLINIVLWGVGEDKGDKGEKGDKEKIMNYEL